MFFNSNRSDSLKRLGNPLSFQSSKVFESNFWGQITKSTLNYLYKFLAFKSYTCDKHICQKSLTFFHFNYIFKKANCLGNLTVRDSQLSTELCLLVDAFP